MKDTFAMGGESYHEGRTLVIAELSANHGGDLSCALESVEAAAEAGADAVKVQTYTAGTMTIDGPQDHFQIKGGTLWDDRSLYEVYEEGAMPWEWQPELSRKCQELGVHFFSSAFDESSVEFLESIDVPAYKIASFELVDLPLIRRAAETGKPMIVSTGMGSVSEIAEAVEAARESGCEDLALLKCTSAYPAPPEEANLRRIRHMAETFGVVGGLSDHTMGSAVPVAAVALGAVVIEKHFILSREMKGPDSAFSMEPSEFRRMVEDIRVAEKAVGEVTYELSEKEKGMRAYRRSIFVSQDIEAGEELTEENLQVIRPGSGMAPRFWKDALGRRARTGLRRGDPLRWSDIA